MTDNEFRDAELIAWADPTETFGQSLHLVAERNDSLRFRIDGNEVEVQGSNCVHKTGPVGSVKNTEYTDHELQEVHRTLALQRCQMTWKYVMLQKE